MVPGTWHVEALNMQVDALCQGPCQALYIYQVSFKPHKAGIINVILQQRKLSYKKEKSYAQGTQWDTTRRV